MEKIVSGTALYFRPLVISAMVSTIVAAWVMTFETLAPNWHGDYLIVLVALVSLETLIVERNLRLRRLAYVAPRSLEVRLAELGLIVLLLKVAVYWQRGWDAFLTDVQMWAHVPESFIDPALVLGLVVVGGAWFFANSLAVDLNAVEDYGALASDREEANSGLRGEFIFGAVAILLAVGAQRVELSPSGLALRPVQLSAAAVLPIVYVALGMLLFGQVRFSVLLETWARQEVPVAPGMERRWARWTVLFIAAVCLVSLLLPAGNTSLGVALFLTLSVVLLFIAQIIAIALAIALGILLAPCMLLFRTTGQAPIGAAPTLPQFAPSQQTPAPEWLLAAQVILFAVIAAASIYFITRTYWQDRRFSGIWKVVGDTVRGWWTALVTWLSPGKRLLQAAMRRKPKPRVPEAPRPTIGWWERWRARSGRERVRRLYLALVERAATAGYPRQSAQTPYEFSAELKAKVAGDEDALEELTDAFVQARYSRRDFRKEQLSTLHRLWQRLNAKLRVMAKLRGQ